MTTEQLPRKGECEGNKEKCGLASCPLFGTLGKMGRDNKRRVKTCGDAVARGKRNRRKGDSKARRARKQLNLGGANTRHEELWGGDLRVEVKAGAQVAGIWTKYLLAEGQSKQQRSIGDPRPFALIAMPDGTNEGLVVMRLSNFAQLFGEGQ